MSGHKQVIKISEGYAALVPNLSPQEYESLKRSIKDNGLHIPLVVNQDGILLDGYHRYKAC
jgi:ParB-like chromosome segregation protein Spo0J